MPRLSPAILRQARLFSPQAATLLPTCRDLPSALNELRWIREHVDGSRLDQSSSTPSFLSVEAEVSRLCRLRGKGVPLQYVLGSQPFGPLDILCRPGVLIPRSEPEAYTSHLARLVQNGLLAGKSGQKLNITDFCTGTGCIPLLLYAQLQSAFPDLHVRGIDISRKAVALARDNAAHNIAKGFMKAPLPSQDLRFEQGDLFSDEEIEKLEDRQWDIITCNPPYISYDGFAHDTSRSVRNFEPKLAQVPERPERYDGCRPEDVFYRRLLDIGAVLKPKVLLVEVGDMSQALRVVEMAIKHSGFSSSDIGVWRDWPDDIPEEHEATSAMVAGKEISVAGSGHGRSIFIQRE